MKNAIDTASQQAESNSTTKSPQGRYFEKELVIPAWLERQYRKARQANSPQSPTPSPTGNGAAQRNRPGPSRERKPL